MDCKVIRGSRSILRRRKISAASSPGCVWIMFRRSRKPSLSFSTSPSLFCRTALRLLSYGPTSYSHSKPRLWQRPQRGCSPSHFLVLSMDGYVTISFFYVHTLVFLRRQLSHATFLRLFLGEGGRDCRLPGAGSNTRSLGAIKLFITGAVIDMSLNLQGYRTKTEQIHSFG